MICAYFAIIKMGPKRPYHLVKNHSWPWYRGLL